MKYKFLAEFVKTENANEAVKILSREGIVAMMEMHSETDTLSVASKDYPKAKQILNRSHLSWAV
jgi:type III secretory pathway lipoprotein EscJ